MPIVTKEIPADRTDSGEEAPEILVQAEGRTLYVTQPNKLTPNDLSVSIIGMSLGQACAVRDALDEFLKAAK